MEDLRRTLSIRVRAWNELRLHEQELVLRAIEARNHAQAPYSHYRVGAALMSQSGAIYRGCNVERSTYTQTSHAEQAAVDAMVVAEGSGTKIRTIAIIGGPAEMHISYPMKPTLRAAVHWEDFCPSCGHCLQIILENCRGNRDVALLQPFVNGLIACTTIGDALPMRFDPSGLGISYE